MKAWARSRVALFIAMAGWLGIHIFTGPLFWLCLATAWVAMARAVWIQITETRRMWAELREDL